MGSSDSLHELEIELQCQLEEQHETFETIDATLAEDPDNEELQQMREQLAIAVKETEQALLQLKRDRLLQSFEAKAANDKPLINEAIAAAAPEVVLDSSPPLAWQPNQRCMFRFTDGRYYLGVVHSVERNEIILQFATPTRSHQLEPLALPAASLLQPRSPPLALHQLEPGSRVIVRPSGCQLWVAGEVLALDPGEGRVRVSTEQGTTLAVDIAEVALSAHVADPWGEEGDSSDGEGGDSGSLTSEGAETWDGGGPSCGEGSDDEDDTGFGRVSVALSDAAAAAAAAAQAGPQTETRLFSTWEAHTRGIGSKMLAGMGYKGGGLGRQQQGLAAPLEAARLRKGAGLGVEPSKGIMEGKQRKRKRGGEKARHRKAAKAAFEQREAARQAQHELEKRTGSEGVFAFINSMIGDGSGAAAVHRAANTEERRAGRSAATAGEHGGDGRRDPHGNAALLQHKKGAQSATAVAKAAPDRRALASQQEQLGVLRQKVSRLAEMAKRNAKDKVMLPQINRALADARAQLQAAEQSHSSAQRAIQDKEKQKKWEKF